MLYQQGDVLLHKVTEVKGKKLNHLTLAKGEKTGHHHTITEGEAELYEHEGTLFLKVNSNTACQKKYIVFLTEKEVSKWGKALRTRY